MEREHPNVTALWGRVRFAGELDLIANLDCVVSMDSLAMHMASLVATPVVSVWGATHPALGFLGYGCPPEGVVQLDLAVSSLFGLRTAALQVRRLPLYAHFAAGRSRPCGGVLVDPSGGGSRLLRPAGSIASCRKIMIL